MARRALPALLVASAAFADASDSRRLALYALLAAIPAVSVAALAVYGELLDGKAGPGRQLQGVLWGLALTMVVTGAAARAPAVRDEALPPLAISALVACLVVLALEAAVGAGRAAVERPPRRRPERAMPVEEMREAA